MRQIKFRWFMPLKAYRNPSLMVISYRDEFEAFNSIWLQINFNLFAVLYYTKVQTHLALLKSHHLILSLKLFTQLLHVSADFMQIKQTLF